MLISILQQGDGGERSGDGPCLHSRSRDHGRPKHETDDIQSALRVRATAFYGSFGWQNFVIFCNKRYFCEKLLFFGKIVIFRLIES